MYRGRRTCLEIVEDLVLLPNCAIAEQWSSLNFAWKGEKSSLELWGREPRYFRELGRKETEMAVGIWMHTQIPNPAVPASTDTGGHKHITLSTHRHTVLPCCPRAHTWAAPQPHHCSALIHTQYWLIYAQSSRKEATFLQIIFILFPSSFLFHWDLLNKHLSGSSV